MIPAASSFASLSALAPQSPAASPPDVVSGVWGEFLGFALRATAAPNPSDKPLVESAPVVGWGDHVWLVPILVAVLAVLAFYVWRRRKRL